MALIIGLIVFLTLTCLGTLLIAVSVNWIQMDQVVMFVERYFFATPHTRIAMGLVGVLLIVVCLRNIQKALRSKRREKLVTFEGSDGGISISVSAIEDLIKKFLEERNIVYIKPKVNAHKRGLEVAIALSLDSAFNIPDFAKEIQTSIKDRLQDILGSEKSIVIRIKVKKIMLSEKEAAQENPEVPFRNF